MRRTRLLRGVLALFALPGSLSCPGAPSNPRQLRAEISALEKEREALRLRVDQQLARDPRFADMPETPVRVAVPTSLIREFLEKLAGGFVDRMTLDLRDIRAHQSGEIRKVVTLGHYELEVTVERLLGRLRTGRPLVRFGGNQVAVELPVSIESGEGQAILHFSWDGSGVSGAVCGDTNVSQLVKGRVQPQDYRVRGGLELRATAEQIVAYPRFPETRIRLQIEPSAESWRAVRRILEQQSGLCAAVLDRIDVVQLLRELVAKGIVVRLPTEKIPRIAVPVRIEPVIELAGKPVALAIRVGGLWIGEQDLRLGAFVSLAKSEAAAGTPRAAPPLLSDRRPRPSP